MGGGLMQLVAYGAQDIYLTGNPQITFFKVVYRRHTNFAMESIEQTWNGSVSNGSRVTATISRNGDLVCGLHLQVGKAAMTADACANPGHGMIDNVELEIGGQQIDKHYGHWMEAWTELTVPNNNMKSMTQGIGDAGAALGTLHQLTTCTGGVFGAGTASDVAHYVPLQFWFCRNPGLALPLIALQYHEVKVNLTFESTTLGITVDDTQDGGIKLWADYVYLDTDERRRFAQVSHEYLIEQVQYQSATASDSIDLNFNHPVKELIWSGVGGNSAAAVSKCTAREITAETKFTVKLNGHDRFAARPLTYFTRYQVKQYHSGSGGMIPTSVLNLLADSIAVYSFALKPEEHQPSGTCNFSRIDNAQLVTSVTTLASDLNIYAVNYNVLRIMSGMGGLAYSN
jgi:hypothetical protein